jgi:curli biogenesis system outer membrane secretion channel CsgG
MKQILLLCFVMVCACSSYCQSDEKTSIAILPFVNNTGNSNNYSSIMQEMVTKEFVKTNRFSILDRSKFQKVMEELKVQKSEEFLNSKVVEQGKLMGAQYLVTGVLNQVDTKKETNTVLDSYTKVYKTQTTWTADVRFSFQVIDVATSSAVYAENIAAVNGVSHSMQSTDAVDNAMCKLKKQVKAAVMKLFPQEILIVSVEKMDKKGLPEQVLISVGSNFFDENYKKGNECETGLADKIGGLFSKKDVVKLKVIEIEVLNVGGKEMKREKVIGMLKLEKVEGDFSICKVDDGEKDIQEHLNAKKKLLVKIL